MTFATLFDSVLLPAVLFAQGNGGGGEGPSSWLAFVPFILVIALFWLMILRPQQKMRQQQEEMLGGIKKNDRVVTKGGIVGVVTSVRRDESKPQLSEVTIKTHEDTRIDILLSTVEATLKKGDSAKKGDDKAES